jgi:hypothetical protein
VVSAPFDVRYGNFAGGLINAVTKSGTNRLEGSILGYFESTDLSGTDFTGSRGEQFDHKEFGLTLGAPIVRDRVALFVNAAIRRQVVPQPVPVPTGETGLDGAGVSHESLVRFQNLLQRHQVDPGTISAGSYGTPSRNLFAKVTAQLGVNSRLEVSHNYGHGNDRRLIGDRGPGVYALSSNGYQIPETINSTRLAWTSAFGARYSNQLILARVDDRRTCIPSSSFPTVSVGADEATIIAGVVDNCLGMETGSTSWELTDNFGAAAGTHHLTFGTHGELIDLVNDPARNPIGSWSFDDLDALERGEPSSYSGNLATEGVQVAFRAEQIGAYVQDQWLATPRLTITAGLRLDVPIAPTPPNLNRAVLDSFGIDTRLTPSGNILWSPRLGVSYDVSGHGTMTLRGGVGLFAGSPAYTWFSNVYGRNASLPFRIDCGGEAAPDFTLDPANQPRTCAGGDTPPPGRYHYFDPEFRFPQNLKVAVGADLQLPGGVAGTLDFLFTRGVNTFAVADVNLFDPLEVATGEGGRAMYGEIDPTSGEAAPLRPRPELDALFELRNGSGGDRAYSVTAQLEKRLASGTGLTVAYTYTNAKDRLSSESDQPGPNVAFSVLNGTLEHRELRTSLWEQPHKLTVTGTTDLPLGLRLGLVYIGGSGGSYTWVVQGDANADGFWFVGDPSNDVVYVPRSPADLTLADPTQFSDLDRLIRDEPCLRSQRGALLRRNSCRDPWVHETQARLAKRFQLAGSRAIEVTADLFNVLNFIDSDWGLVRRTSTSGFGSGAPLLELVGWDTANGRGRYRLADVFRREIDVEASRWRLQLGGMLFF